VVGGAWVGCAATVGAWVGGCRVGAAVRGVAVRLAETCVRGVTLGCGVGEADTGALRAGVAAGFTAGRVAGGVVAEAGADGAVVTLVLLPGWDCA
jgi:hypothetical protein